MAKRPAPGKTKTRLTPPLSPERAADLYERLLQDSLDIARAVPNVTRWIAFAPEDADEYFRRLAPDFKLLPQVGTDLGERLDAALSHCLANGSTRAVIMDSDSPTLPTTFVTSAIEGLEEADVTLGPCEDGGYYLIGLKQPQPRLLRNVQMSTSHVLRDTLAAAHEAGLRVSLLPTWHDVDTGEELEKLRRELGESGNDTAPHTREFLAAPA